MAGLIDDPIGHVPLKGLAYGAEGETAQPVTRDYPLPILDPLLNEAIRSIA